MHCHIKIIFYYFLWEKMHTHQANKMLNSITWKDASVVVINKDIPNGTPLMKMMWGDRQLVRVLVKYLFLI